MTDPELERVWHVYRSGRPVEAESQLREALSRRPDSEWGLRLLSAALSRQGRLDEALEAAEEACRVAPDQARTWMQLASVRIHRHEASEAVAAAERGVACAPHHADAHYIRARAFQTTAERYRPDTAYDPQRALDAADEAVRLSPGEVEYRNTRAWALVLLKRRSDAEREYRGVLVAAPNNSAAVNGLGWLRLEQRPILAARYFAAALALSPQSLVIQINLRTALRSWLYRMIWIWLWAGVTMGVLRWFVSPLFVALLVAATVTTSLVGCCLLGRHFPGGTLRSVWGTPPTPPGFPLPARLVGSVSVALITALAPPAIALPALVLLMTFMLLEWKVNFDALDRRLKAWRARAPS